MNDDMNDENVPIRGEGKIFALLAKAEEFADPLEGLAERAKLDPGAPFAPEAIDALVVLRQENRPRYETLVAALKSSGVRVAQLEKEMSRHQAMLVADVNRSQGDVGDDLSGLVMGLHLFRSSLGDAYADVDVAGHRETMAVDSRDFADYLGGRYYTAQCMPPRPEELRSAISLARARAINEGPVREVHVRVAQHGERSYIDLGDREWRAVEVDATGWSIVSSPPVRFVRPKGYGTLPDPQVGGSVEMLRKYVNTADDQGFFLVVAWLLAALRATGPYPLLCVAGQQGSSKSTLTRLLKSIVDPHAVPLRSMPRDERDLMIAAKNTHVLAIDNISRVSNVMSDALCRMSTGGGFSTRRLFSDADETHFVACRPVILNGIDEIVSKADLADRALFLELREIGPAARKPAQALDRDFCADLPFILGSLLDLIVYGLRRVDKVELEELPRMADFAVLVAACDGAIWAPGTLTSAIQNNTGVVAESIIERTPVAGAVLHLMDKHEEVRGTASQILRQLEFLVDVQTKRSNDWPKSPGEFSKLLRRQFATLLRDQGIEVFSVRVGNKRNRIMTLRRLSAAAGPGAGSSGESE